MDPENEKSIENLEDEITRVTTEIHKPPLEPMGAAITLATTKLKNEIERLTRQLEFVTKTIKAEQVAHDETKALLAKANAVVCRSPA